MDNSESAFCAYVTASWVISQNNVNSLVYFFLTFFSTFFSSTSTNIGFLIIYELTVTHFHNLEIKREENQLAFRKLFTESKSLFTVFLVSIPFPAFTVAKLERSAPWRNNEMWVYIMVSWQAKISEFFKWYEGTFFLVSQEKTFSRKGCQNQKNSKLRDQRVGHHCCNQACVRKVYCPCEAVALKDCNSESRQEFDYVASLLLSNARSPYCNLLC